MCDSDYERRVIELIDRDDDYIVTCDSQSIKLTGNIYDRDKEYWPDFLLYTQDRAIIVLEVKNKENILLDQFFLKAKLCRKLCQELHWGFVVTIPGLPHIEELFTYDVPTVAKDQLLSYIDGRRIYRSFNSGITKRATDWVKRQHSLDETAWLALCLQAGIATKEIAGKTYYGLLSERQSWRDILVG